MGRISPLTPLPSRKRGFTAVPNIVSREDIPVGLIDGEYAGSADPLVELAQAAWLNVRPFSDDVAEIARSGARGRWG